MLQKVNIVYLFFSFTLYTILAFKVPQEYILIDYYAIVSVISYFIILYINSNLEKNYYNSFYLAVEVFLYATVFVFLENSISYYYHGNFFVFSESDALFYHKTAIKLIHMPFSQAVDYYLDFMGFDDLGIILVLYPLYLISQSNLILNVFYIFVGVITALSLFSLGRNFLSRKYAFLASLAYSLASFTLFFHATGLKESFMIMLIVLSYDYIYKFLYGKNILYLLFAVAFLSAIIFFRPALSAMILLSLGLGAMLSSKGGIITKILSFIIFLALIAFSNQIMQIVDTYTAGGVDALIYARETQGMIKGSLAFTYFVNVISQTLGPLPTLLSPSKVLTMFYAPGLIYRTILAVPFWLGVYYIYKQRLVLIYPITIFIFAEMASLVFLIDGLELRKAMPHIPLVFLIAFWFLDKYDHGQIIVKSKKRFEELLNLIFIILLAMIIYWNFR